MKPREFIEKLRAQPDGKKKIIVWALTIFVALGVFGWWIRGVENSLSEFRGDANELPPLQISLPPINIELPSPTPSLEEESSNTPTPTNAGQ